MERRPMDEEQRPQEQEGLSAGAQELAQQLRQQLTGGQEAGPRAAQAGMATMAAVPQTDTAGGMPPMGGQMQDQRPIDPLSVGAEPQKPAGEPFRSRMSKERITEALAKLTRFKSGKGNLESRILEDEQWWKIRHWEWMQEKGARDDMRTASAWLFNVIVSKHADGIQSIPEANILPRERQDQETARALRSIIPCVLEQNRFDEVYSDVLWQKLKGGTGAYGVFWDGNKLNGLGDIAIRKVNLLHLFWEPGISDIQDSSDVFYLEAVDIDRLKSMYPDKVTDQNLTGRVVSLRKFMTEDPVNDDNKAMVVDWYYHTYEGGRQVLQYCKFVGDVVLYATEDDDQMRGAGLYEHGLYPFVLDALFPVEGSPCGFGYIDVCKGAQEQIDILNQAVTRNALINAIPRYFVRSDGSVNEEEFMDFTRPVVHVTGNLGADSIAPISPTALNANVVNIINNKITELKETSGNTDSSNGVGASASQAASAIAALQEASGKVSRASTLSAYRAFERAINLVVELIRQFYDQPRQFRILGENGQQDFMTFDNSGMAPQAQGVDFGYDMGYRLPVFDIKVEAQTKTAYTKNSMNELALSLYQQGVFNPQQTDQALMLLDMMEFEGKEDLRQKISEQGTMMQQLAQFQQIALQLAQQVDPMLAERIAQMIMAGGNAMQAQAAQGMAQQGSPMNPNGPDPGGAQTKMNNARKQAQTASQPGGR